MGDIIGIVRATAIFDLASELVKKRKKGKTKEQKTEKKKKKKKNLFYYLANARTSMCLLFF